MTRYWGDFICVILLVAACSGKDSNKENLDASIPTDGAETDGGSTTTDAVAGDDSSTEPCVVGEHSCVDTGHQRVCEEVGGVPTWVDRACDPYEYCLTDHCEEACLDECVLGSTRTSGGQLETCRLYSQSQQTWVEPGDSMHDKARRYEAWLREKNLANGFVCETLFSDTTYEAPIAYLGTVDAAEWTGTYMAAESARLLATHSPDAEQNLEDLVDRFYDLFSITGDPGSMARVWAPLGEDSLFDNMYDSSDTCMHQTTYKGSDAFWHGCTSRDMYSGALMGLSFAYDALWSEPHREKIRELCVTFATGLIEMRVDLPVTVRFYVMGSWQEQTLTVDVQHVVPVPIEMVDGAVYVQVGTEEDPEDYDASEMLGIREFFPRYNEMLSQVPVLGSLIPEIPRPGSSVMLALYLRAALHVTQGVPEYAADRAAIEAHYQDNIQDWLSVMEQYTYHNASECWKQYFGLTIVYHPIYGLIRLETDASVKSTLQQNVLADRMWTPVQDHKNPYFAYIAASQGPAGLLGTDALSEIENQLRGFVSPPKAKIAVDNTGSYPADPECPGQTTEPIDVASRVPTDFLWQHNPFKLTTLNPVPNLSHAPVDYLVAYWFGRYHGFLEDDSSDTCLRWAP